MEALIAHLSSWPPLLGYLVVFFLMIIEGDVTLFTFAFLTSQGIFSIFYMALAVITGTLFGDALWYGMGRYGFQLRIFSWLKIIVTHMSNPFDSHLQARPFHTLFLSRFTYGIHHALLARAGMLKIPWRTVFKIDAPAIACWTLTIGSLGYFAGASFGLVKNSLRFGQFVILAVVIFVIVERMVRTRVKKRL